MKLTQIVKILDLQPIPDADRIERARVLAWDVVVMKGLHKVGDLVCFVFPDTLIPKKFLDSSYEGDEKVRLKTVKLKGQYSAGLVIPLSEVEKYAPSINEGDDVAEFLRIEKYEKPMSAQLAGMAKGGFPSFVVPKTDEDNYRSNPDTVEEMKALGDEEIYMSCKLDGSSATFISDDEGIRVCSRNLELKRSEENLFWQLAGKYSIEDFFKEYHNVHGIHLAIQGEACGPGVNGNSMGYKEHCLGIFLIKDITNNRWWSWDETVQLCVESNYLQCVEEVGRLKAKDLNFDELQKLADTLKYPNGKPAEGIVVRPVRPISSNTLGKSWMSLKVISQPYDQKN
jgi:RNA ligase (TIGR02306 family)